jgi:hypothetical protein
MGQEWRAAVRANLLLIALAGPLVPLQSFALPMGIAALVSLETAFLARRDLTKFVSRATITGVTRKVPRLNSVSAR